LGTPPVLRNFYQSIIRLKDFSVN